MGEGGGGSGISTWNLVKHLVTVTRHTIKYLEITLYVYKRYINNLLFINLFFGHKSLSMSFSSFLCVGILSRNS